MKRLLLIVLSIITLTLNVVADGQKHILLLNSYHQEMPWVKDITKGVYDALELDKNNFLVHVENMDTINHQSSEYYTSLANLYKEKYAHIKIDIIVSSDNNALDFLKKYKNEIFGEEVPVSFCGVNNYEPSLLKGYKNYTGIAESLSEIENIELILKLHPNAKEIYVLNDYLTSGRAEEQLMRQIFKPYENRIKFTYAKEQTLKELQNTILNLSQDTVILVGGYNANKDKQYITYETMAKQLLDLSPVPVYCLIYYNISKGVIGGKVTSGYYQGSMAANLALDILKVGVDVEDIAVVSEGANRFIFNKKALDKFNIDTELLPKNSIIINDDEESFYEKYSFAISLILVILSILVAAVIALYYYKKNLINEKVVVKLLLFGPIIFIPTIFSILLYSILLNNKQNHNENIQKIITEKSKTEKNIVKSEVEQLARMSYIFKNNQEKLFEYINSTRYGKSGYFFAMDKEGTVLAHGDNKDLIGKDISHLKDKNNNLFIKQIVSNALANNKAFTNYQWEHPPTRKLGTKYTYSMFLPQYDIVIGSGLYDEDIKLVTDKIIAKLNIENKRERLQIVWISFSIIVTFLILAIIFANMIRKIFENYNAKIDKKNKALEKLNLSLEEKVQEELRNNQEKDILLFQQSKMAAMGEMLDNIAHQWRQPLSIITVSASGMKMQKEFGVSNDEQEMKTLENITSTAEYLSQTIDDFRGFLKDSKKETLFNIKDVLKKAEFLTKSLLTKHKIEFIDTIEDTMIKGLENELVQVFMNLISNSKDAFSQEQKKRYIFINLIENDEKKLVIEIKDNAGGIKIDPVDKVFEQRFTTREEKGGTGVGLYMSKQIIEKSFQGKLSVYNADFQYNSLDCKGAVFRIELNKL